MFDYEKEYSELKNAVAQMRLGPTESQRVRREFELFEKRGWQNYIVLLAKIMRETRERYYTPDSGSYEGGSACDSYVLRKIRNTSCDFSGFLGSRKCEEILFNDALRMIYIISEPHGEMSYCFTKELDRVIDPIVKGSGLHYQQRITKKGPLPEKHWKEMIEETLVLSNDPIDNEDFELIVNEPIDSSPSENDRLRRFLIIKVVVGLYGMTWEEAAREGERIYRLR